MDKFYLDILPEFKDKPAILLNLNDIATQTEKQSSVSRFLNPYLTNRFLSLTYQKLGVAYSFGGYLEDRKDLWRGSYLGHDNAVHLGIDVNVPQRTMVSVKYPCQIESIVHDPNQKGGWGSTVLFSLENAIGPISHFLYGHLSRDDVSVIEKQKLSAGEIVGKLGTLEENGGWYEHLHVQAITKEAWEKFNGNLFAFDGYGYLPEDGQAHALFPDPMPLL
jgi:hypothetical protein